MTTRIVLAALLAALFLPSALARATYRSDKHKTMRGSLIVTLPL
jgi:hypothetical protein